MIGGFGSVMADDVLTAGVDLVGRTGATNIQIGYLRDDVPVAEAGWYAQATYCGTRITVEDQPHPASAVDGLARRLLDGGKCVRCGRLITLDPAGGYAHDAVLIDGTPWLVEQQAAEGVCLWRREGSTWVGCTPPRSGRQGGSKRTKKPKRRRKK